MNFYLPRQGPAALQEAAAPAEGPLRLVTVGQLIPRKAVDVLLEAVAGIPDLHDRLSVVGDGPDRHALEARAESLPVEFVGPVPMPEVPVRLRQAEVFLFPTRLDGWGMALLEAGSEGLALVGSTAAESTDMLVEDGKTGWRVPPGDPDALGAAIRRLVEQQAGVAEMGRKAWARARDAVAARSVDHLLSVLANPNAGTSD